MYTETTTTKQSNSGLNGRWLNFGTSAVVILTAVGAMFYVAFQGSSNYQAIVRLQTQVDTNADVARGLRLEQAQMRQALVEIETQFCAQDIVRNLMHATEMRQISMLWEKAMGTKWPTDNAYYPTICARGQAIGSSRGGVQPQ